MDELGNKIAKLEIPTLDKNAVNAACVSPITSIGAKPNVKAPTTIKLVAIIVVDKFRFLINLISSNFIDFSSINTVLSSTNFNFPNNFSPFIVLIFTLLFSLITKVLPLLKLVICNCFLEQKR